MIKKTQTQRNWIGNILEENTRNNLIEWLQWWNTGWFNGKNIHRKEKPEIICSDCKELKKISELVKKNNHLGYVNFCQGCHGKRSNRGRNLGKDRRRCTKCFIKQPARTSEYFGKNNTGIDGLTRQCKKCIIERQKKWRKKEQ